MLSRQERYQHKRLFEKKLSLKKDLNLDKQENNRTLNIKNSNFKIKDL